MEKKMKNEMETGGLWVFMGIRVYQNYGSQRDMIRQLPD